ncbi:alpha-L-fucosidase [Pedobacter endophyticus]|uniref:alpha-L-fucosidase n=1 Tax=Pedobacter endophyticus TaxID=2789740 RepID=A0A7S9PYX6_9SPHI|nr:alpha-L-fucosidase [Pedobacter endophyticus]QPH39037.1 alpha-L-fucosidase [Pedobacter endophyticus]
MIRITTIILLMLTGSFLAGAQTKNQMSPSIEGFMEKRFGMFIHWGPVSLRGTEIGWSRGKEVDQQEYDNLYKEFNPVLFDADAWVKTAKDAGMKYLTITARHHDGFCLWPSEYTDYDISNTPYKKDIVGALNEACKKQGINFCIYYSVLDWYHPDYPIHNPKDRNGSGDPKANMPRYVQFMKNQLKELITNYDPYMLWFDGQWEKPWTEEMGRDMYAYLKNLKPSLVINNRLGKEMAGVKNVAIDHSKMIGDYDTPEQAVGKLNMEMPWESCFTIANQWAWKPNDKLKSLKECLTIFSKTIGGNGNLLLNVGPMPDGRIEQRQIDLLKEMGDWLKINSEAVYGTMGGPYQPNDNFATTRKGNKLYVNILNTDTTAIELKAIPDRKIVKSYAITGSPVSIEQSKDKIVIPVTKSKNPYVVVLELNKTAESISVIK